MPPDANEQDPNIENNLPSKFAADTIIANVADSGGCAWGGVCSSYNMRLNGVVEVLQPVKASGDTTEMQVIAIRRVRPASVSALLSDIQATDFQALKASFGEGSCQGCVDGIDNYIMLMPGNGDIAADSVIYDLRMTKNVFSRALGLVHTAVPGLPEGFDIDDVKDTDVIARVSYLGGRASAHYAYDIKRNGDVDVFKVIQQWPRQEYEAAGTFQLSPAKTEALLTQIAQTDYIATFEAFTPGKTRNHTDGNDTYISLLPETADISTNSAAHAFYMTDNIFQSAADLGQEASLAFWTQQNKTAN